jgi:hypothetical protein
MDCFAGARNDASALSRRGVRPSCARTLSLERQRAQGKPGAQCTRSLACKVKKHTSVITTGSPNWSGLPCAMVLTAYTCSPVNGSFATVAGGITSADLTPASRRQDHTISPSASAPLVNGTSASIASRPAFVTTRTPLLSRREVRTVPQFLIFGKQYFWAPGLETQISLNPLTKLVFRPHAIWRRRGPDERGESVRIDQTDLPDVGQRGGAGTAGAGHPFN